MYSMRFALHAKIPHVGQSIARQRERENASVLTLIQLLALMNTHIRWQGSYGCFWDTKC